MTNTQVFNISTAGLYPYEKYVATPITFTIGTLPIDFTSIFWNQLDGRGPAIVTGGSLITRNYLNYHKNPLCQVLNHTDLYYNNIIDYQNVTFNRVSDKYIVSTTPISGSDTVYAEKVPTITISNTTTNGTTLTFNISSLRTNHKTPYEFNLFYIQLNDATKNSYGYIIYPSRLYLQPISLTNNNNKWQLTTRVKVISSQFVHIQSSDFEKDALNTHLNRLKTTPPNITNIPDHLCNNVDNLIKFEFFGSRTSSNSPLISLSSFGLVPPLSTFYLNDGENKGDIQYVYPDSTFLTYSGIYVNSVNTISETAQSPKDDSYFYGAQYFNPTFILNYDPINQIQNYQLIQRLINPSYALSNTRNTILSAGINLNNGYVDFYSGYSPAQMKFKPEVPLAVNYTVDCNILANGQGALATLVNSGVTITDGITPYTLSNATNTFLYNITGKDIIWETDYPPYNYNYKVLLSDSSNAYLDSNTLNFYLKLSVIYQDSQYVNLSAGISSDFNTINTVPSNQDYIRFKIISTSIENDNEFMNYLTCWYGTGNEFTEYNISENNPSKPYTGYVPFRPEGYLKIDYSNAIFRGIKFSVQASLATTAGTLDSFNTANITLAAPIIDIGNKIFLNIVDEKSNEITVDASFNVTEEEWPAIDLRNSTIKWFYGNGNNLSLNYVNQQNDFLSSVVGVTGFDANTWRVKLSGYGPYLATVSLSSEKYTQIATVSTNPNLFDFLSLGKLQVGHVKPLNNLDFTRYVELTAAIPYGNSLFNIPENIPINWTWTYDNESEPDSQPINVKQTLYNNRDYIYGIDMMPRILSAIRINVTPSYSDDYPRIHNVKALATINATQPPITGEYLFSVDDFPSKRLFNCDFVTFYQNYQDDPSFIVADTRTGKNVITRAESSILNFTFSAKKDVISTISNAHLNWAYNDIKNSVYEDVYNIQLKDPLSGLSAKNILGTMVSSVNITLVLSGGYALGWTSAHNVSATTHIHILPSIDFYKPLEFILFPEYAWFDSTNLTFLSTDPTLSNYFTNAYAPTAYLNKKSNSQTYWFSANKQFFTDYIYQNKQNFSIVSTQSSYDVLDFPYNPFNYTVVAGVPISLIAYNDIFYPSDIDITYIDEVENINFVPIELRLASSGNTYLVTQTHNITSKSIDVIKYSDEDVYSNFRTSPKFKNYSDVLLRYTTYANGNNYNIFNIDLSGTQISIEHVLETIPENSPSVVNEGNATYYLSSYYWTVSTVIPLTSTYVSSYHDLFFIKYGDPSIPYFSGEQGGTSEFRIYAESVLKQQIPWTTFSNYPSSYFRYPEDPSLWSEIIISS